MYYEAIDRWNSPNSYLEHHGVKGMKWGVRHSPVRTGNVKRSRTIGGKQAASSKRRGLSTGAKVAIGIAGTAAAIGAAGYLGVKYGPIVAANIIQRKAMKMTNEAFKDTVDMAKSISKQSFENTMSMPMSNVKKSFGAVQVRDRKEENSFRGMLNNAGVYNNSRNPVRKENIKITTTRNIARGQSTKRTSSMGEMAKTLSADQITDLRNRKEVQKYLAGARVRKIAAELAGDAKESARNRNDIKDFETLSYYPSYATKSGNRIKKRLRTR